MMHWVAERCSQVSRPVLRAGHQTPSCHSIIQPYGADDQHHTSQEAKRPGKPPDGYRLLSDLPVQHDDRV